MRRVGNVQAFAFLVSVVVSVTQSQTAFNNGRVRHIAPSTNDLRTEQNKDVRLNGLCRDGWTAGTMLNVSGTDIPICLKINSRALSWEEAKSACRKDYGFLMKLDSFAKWGDDELLDVLLEEGITYTWTGIHTEYGRLVWDDLIPSQVIPTGLSGNSSVTLRPWRWDSNRIVMRPDYCGYIKVNPVSEDRKKRATEDDIIDTISNFDFPGERIFNTNNYRPQMSMLNFPRTSAFKSELSRTQLADQLPELQSTSLGLQSALQIPGSGISSANIQGGGLSATLMPTFETATITDAEENKEIQSTFDVVESINKEMGNPTDLVNAVKEEDTQGNDMPLLSPLEKLIGHMKEMQDIQSDASESKSSIGDVAGENTDNADSAPITTTPSLPDNVIKDAQEQLQDINPLTAESPPDSVGESSLDTHGKNKDTVKELISIDTAHPETSDRTQITNDTESDEKKLLSDIIKQMKDTLDAPSNTNTNSTLSDDQEAESPRSNETDLKTDSLFSQATTTMGHELTEKVKTIDNDINENSDNDGLEQNFTDPVDRLNVPTESPFILTTNKELDATRDVDKSAVDNDEVDGQRITDKHYEMTSMSLIMSSSTHGPTTQLVKSLNSIPYIDEEDADFDTNDNRVTSVSIPDVPEVFTTSTHSKNDDDDNNEQLEDTTKSIVRPIFHKEKKTDEKDENLIDINESADDISDVLSNYLSQFSNESETANLEIENSKSDNDVEHATVTFPNKKKNDEISDGLEDFINSFKGNETEDDLADNKVDKDTGAFFTEGEQGDDLLKSVKDIHNAILGLTDNDNPIDNDNNEIEVDNSHFTDNESDPIEFLDKDIHEEFNETDQDNDVSVSKVLEEVYENDEQDTSHSNKTKTNSDTDDQDITEMKIQEHDDVDDIVDDNYEHDTIKMYPNDASSDDAKDHIEVGSRYIKDTPDASVTDMLQHNEDLDERIFEVENGGDKITHEGGDIHDNHEHEVVGFDESLDDALKDESDKTDKTDTIKESEDQEDQNKKLSEIKEEMRNPDNIEEIVTQENTMTPLKKPQYVSSMILGSCETRLPSVCFSYEVEVMAKSTTCDDGWYGHVLLDTCFKILDRKMDYHKAEAVCNSFGARIVLGDGEFQRKFVLIAVQKEGKFHRGEKFWKESRSMQRDSCSYFSERDSHVDTSCNAVHRVVCIKDAKSLSVHTMHDDQLLGLDSSGDEEKIEFSSHQFLNNPLKCDLASAASEFPVLWFKDGVLVKTLDKYVSKDISLLLDNDVLDMVSHVTKTNMSIPVLQGKYWCEVWDRKTLTRKRSRGYDVRFTDVISFHGSMELRGFNNKQEVLFNMISQRFESLKRTEMDIQRVFQDVLPLLQGFSSDVTNVYTYADSVRSKPSVIEYHTFFTLNRDYTTHDEHIVYNQLKALLRSQLGNRRYMAGLEGKTSIQSFRTMSLQSTVACPATSLQTNRDMFGRTIPLKSFSFPKALIGDFANSINNCSESNQLPGGTARCLGDFHTGAYWGDLVANECIDESRLDDINEEIWGVSPFTQQLAQMSETPVNKTNVDHIIQNIAHIADVSATFTPTDINKIADILDHSTKVPALPEKVAENIVRTVNKVIEIEEKKVHIANLETKAANRILKSVERFAENINLKKKSKTRIVSDNVVVEIWDLKRSAKPVIGLAAETRMDDADIAQPFKTEKIATVFESSQLYDIDVDAAIELPKEVFERREHGESIANRLTMVVYRNSKLFDAAFRLNSTGTPGQQQHIQMLNSYIISASIAGKKISGLTDKVRTIFRPLRESDKSRKCVWWDFMMNDFKGGWSTKGCRYDGKMNGRDVCLCDHLTNFAVLLDFYGQAKPIEDYHELSLSIITVVGLSLSILGLSLTIISYIFFRKLRQGRAQQTLFNLSLALLFSMTVFLIGIKQTHNHYVCLIVAVLLHYFILVSFMWMLMEAMLQYLTFVKILGTYITRFTMKTVLPCWGLPFIPVIAVLSVNYNLYDGGPKYCWMSLSAFYYAFAIPVSIIILINVVIFLITIVSIFRRGKGLRSNQKKQKIAMTNLQAAITSFILLGLTWVFGYLAISDARIVFQYIFTILNSLQGFFIFILFVLRKKKVRDQWYIICCRNSEKDRVSRSLSATNSIPSSCSSGSRNGRTKGERDRSDSTKTVQSTYSNSSNGFTNYGYESGFDTPFNRYDKRYFRHF